MSSIITDVLDIRVPKNLIKGDKSKKVLTLINENVKGVEDIKSKIALLTNTDFKSRKSLIVAVIVLMSLILVISSNPVAVLVFTKMIEIIQYSQLSSKIKTIFVRILRFVIDNPFFRNIMSSSSLGSLVSFFGFAFYGYSKTKTPEKTTESLKSKFGETFYDFDTEKYRKYSNSVVILDKPLDETTEYILETSYPGTYDKEILQLNIGELGINTEKFNKFSTIKAKYTSKYNGTNPIPLFDIYYDGKNLDKKDNNIEIISNEAKKENIKTQLINNTRTAFNQAELELARITDSIKYNKLTNELSSLRKELKKETDTNRVLYIKKKISSLEKIEKHFFSIELPEIIPETINKRITTLKNISKASKIVEKQIKAIKSDNFNILYKDIYNNQKILQNIHTQAPTTSIKPLDPSLLPPPPQSIKEFEKNVSKAADNTANTTNVMINNIVGNTAAVNITNLTKQDQNQSHLEKTPKYGRRLLSDNASKKLLLEPKKSPVSDYQSPLEPKKSPVSDYQSPLEPEDFGIVDMSNIDNFLNVYEKTDDAAIQELKNKLSSSKTIPEKKEHQQNLKKAKEKKNSKELERIIKKYK